MESLGESALLSDSGRWDERKPSTCRQAFGWVYFPRRRVSISLVRRKRAARVFPGQTGSCGLPRWSFQTEEDAAYFGDLPSGVQAWLGCVQTSCVFGCHGVGYSQIRSGY